MLRGTHPHGPLRCSASGDYRPGRLARVTQWLIRTALPKSAHERLARRFRANSERLRAMEGQAEWLRRNPSPLRVLGLPDTETDLRAVRQRYKALTVAHHPDQGGSRGELERVRAAYAMLADSRSLWYLNGHSGELAMAAGRRFDQRRQIRWLGLCAYAGLLCGMCWAGWALLVPALEGLLRWADPRFFAFMLRREAVDRADREAGRPVDPDPAKLAPKQIQKLRKPGRYLDEL